jgi:hypothetical protein
VQEAGVAELSPDEFESMPDSSDVAFHSASEGFEVDLEPLVDSV